MLIMHVYPFFVTTAPDESYLLSMYPMAEERDFAQQTVSVNANDDFLNTEKRRVICLSMKILILNQMNFHWQLHKMNRPQCSLQSSLCMTRHQFSLWTMIVSTLGGMYSSILFFNNYNSSKITLV